MYTRRNSYLIYKVYICIYNQAMKMFMVSLADSLLEDIDEYCKKYKYNRSELTRTALRSFVYFEKPKTFQEGKTPNVINKAIEVEKKVEEVKKKTSHILNSPLSSKGTSAFSFCPKHGVFYSSCGCTPK